MANKQTLTPEAHKLQIDAYEAQFPAYKTYADALKRVLEKACGVSLPEAFVQARPKSVASFAEKCVRKQDKYKDPVNNMTDLCGARVLVQTLEQVKAVRLFIEANFKIGEQDDKGLLLGADVFGYRDMHYIIRIIPEKAAALGFKPDEVAAIGDKRAEVQVRTWVQHAWADTLHDRMYKTKLRYPAEFKRTGALLAAIMEDGDRAFDRLALDIDGMLANYSAYASKVEVEREVGKQSLILANAPDAKKPGIAIQLARLVSAGGEYARVVRELAPFTDLQGPVRCELLLELGFALCKVHRAAPKSADYRRGQRYLDEVVKQCACDALTAVPNLRKCRSLHARALARQAWSWEVVPGEAHRARDAYRQALAVEPGNPYYLADVLGYEAHCAGNTEFVASMATTLREAIRTCAAHAVNGTELPYACFTAGRLHLLLNEPHLALGCYARGIRYMLAGTYCVPADTLDAEIAWLLRVGASHQLTGGYLWARQTLELAKRVAGVPDDDDADEPATAKTPLTPPVLIMAGGAGSLTAEVAGQARPMLTGALAGFRGTVISGGTDVGIPGCVGEIAGDLKDRGAKSFDLVGYIPRLLPHDAPRDARYDRFVTCGEQGFSPEQIIRNWQDILAAGIAPKDVQLLGIGGGDVCSVEYRLALALGASVAVVQASGGAADALIADPWWTAVPNLLVMPFDTTTLRAFIIPPAHAFTAEKLEEMAQAFHKRYVDGSTSRLPANMRPWDKLDKTFQTANREQARYAVEILTACGFTVRTASDPAKLVIFAGFTDAEVERMAELEHGRWNVDRLRDGWRPGTPRDDAKKIHNSLVTWSVLPDEIKHYDRDAVKEFPAILARAGLEVSRK
jgi:ppGpp synthetase/RelA/SpoT-type nucleotidyltranferase